jgi:hypothetical protein
MRVTQEILSRGDTKIVDPFLRQERRDIDGCSS